MTTELLQQLEKKIDTAIESIELMRLQIEELEETNKQQKEENANLKSKHQSWEQNLSKMLDKLENVEVKETTEAVAEPA